MIQVPDRLRMQLSSANQSRLDTFAGQVAPVYATTHIVGMNDHGPRHILRVLEHFAALFCHDGQSKFSEMELLLALTAIIAHDIGMTQGRDEHAETATKIIEKLKAQFEYLTDGSSTFLEFVKDAVRSHSSSTRLEMIQTSVRLGSTPINVRAVAAAVRLSDEVDEDGRRAIPLLMEVLNIPATSQFFWTFNQIISGIGREGTSLVVDLVLSEEILDTSVKLKTKSGGEHEMPFLMPLAKKLAKLIQEAFYCSAHLLSAYQFRRVVLVPRIGRQLCPEISLSGDWVQQGNANIVEHLIKSRLTEKTALSSAPPGTAQLGGSVVSAGNADTSLSGDVDQKQYICRPKVVLAVNTHSMMMIEGHLKNVDVAIATQLRYGLRYGESELDVHNRECLEPGESVEVLIHVSPDPWHFTRSFGMLSGASTKRDPHRQFVFFCDFSDLNGDGRRMEIPIVLPAPEFEYIERIGPARYFVKVAKGWVVAT